MANESEINQIVATVARLEAELRLLRTQLAQLHPAERTGPVATLPQATQETPPPSSPAPMAVPPIAPPRAVLPPPPPPTVPARAPLQPATLLAIAGSALFLLGVLFFLWLSIQRGWINPTARVILGLATAGALLGITAKFLPSERRTVAVAILAAALGTLDFSAFAGFSLYHLYPAALGFGLAVAGALLAGGLGARHRCQAALAVGLVAALTAPPLFSTGGHHEIALALYLAGLMAALLLVPYRAGVGATWGVVRWLAVVGVWLLLATSLEGLREEAPVLMALIAGHLLLSLLWVWQPGPSSLEKPASPLSLWALVLMAAASILWMQWKQAGWPREAFALPVLALGALNLGLVKPMRARFESTKADFGLLALGAAFLSLALPIALAWHWVGPLWGLFALALAYASDKMEETPDWTEEERANLRRLALGLVILASLRWLFTLEHTFGLPGAARTPFLNASFALAATATGAWLLLARRSDRLAALGFLAAQVMGNLGAAFEIEALARQLGATPHSASVTLTVAFAVSGALQWLSSLRVAESQLRRGLTAAGYTWLAIASGKLIFVDLAQADLAARALAFLAVGGIFLAAALVGARARQSRTGE